MRILIVHNLYRWRGGEDDMALRLADLLEAHGHSVHRFFADSRELVNASRARQAHAALEAFGSASAARRLNAVIDTFKPDIAHVFNVLPLLSPAIYDVLAQRGIPLFHSIQNFKFLCPSGFAFTRGEICLRCRKGNTAPAVWFRCCHGEFGQSLLYAMIVGVHRRRGTLGGKTGHLLPVNSILARVLQEEFPRAQVTVVPNFVETANVEPRTDFGRNFGFIGRLFPEKGVATLIEAIGRLPDIGLDIVGDGLQADALKQQAEAAAKGRVIFHGYQAGPERFETLRRCTAIVVPSVWHDACPLVVLEAMALGVPVVASRLGGLPDLVSEGETGWLFEAGRVDELAGLLRRLADDPGLVSRMGQAARRRAETEFGSERYYQRMSTLYAGSQ